MAKSGRLIRISRNGNPVVGARADNITINNEPVDITDKDDAGWRTLLAESGKRTITMEVEGVMKVVALPANAVGNSAARFIECACDIDGIGVLTGDFYFTNLNITGEDADTIMFTATFESGAVLTSQTIAPYVTVLPLITVSGGADSGNLSADTGTWAGDATITFATVWQVNNTSSAENDPNWLDAAGEVAAETRHAAGDFVRVQVTATNSVGSTVAYSLPVT